MKTNSSSPHRRIHRLPEFDYSQPGAYFVTIVTQDRKTLFGQIVDGEMVLNDIGKMVKEVIDQIPEHYPGINVELFVVMPNHIHALLLITDVVAGPRACQTDQTNNDQPQGVDPTEEWLPSPVLGSRVCQTDQTKSGQPQRVDPTEEGPYLSNHRTRQSNDGQPQGVDPTQEHFSLPDIVHRIKSLTTHQYIMGVRNNGWPQFEKRLWQPSYYEHVIRNERDYQAIYDYILANPMNWEKDQEFSHL